jgi:hypothetical protein
LIDVFQVETDLAQKNRRVARSEVDQPRKKGNWRPRTTNPEAYDAELQALSLSILFYLGPRELICVVRVLSTVGCGLVMLRCLVDSVVVVVVVFSDAQPTSVNRPTHATHALNFFIARVLSERHSRSNIFCCLLLPVPKVSLGTQLSPATPLLAF